MSIEKLMTMGINASDIKKLKEAGIVSVGFLSATPRKARSRAQVEVASDVLSLLKFERSNPPIASAAPAPLRGSWQSRA